MGEAKGRMRVLHRTKGGRGWVDAPDDVGLFYLEAGPSYTTVNPPAAPDVDGDGEPELWLSIFAKEHEGGGSISIFAKEHEGGGSIRAGLLRFRRSVIEAVPGLPENYHDLRDVDGDGHRDLLYHPYTGSGESPCSGFGYDDSGPAFLAHARPDGTFSVDDDEAKRHARSLCPAGASEAPAANDDERAAPIICARLRGEPVEAALRLLARRCRPPGPGDDGCRPAPDVCFDYAMRAAWARREPPLTLR
jgi:hypothetical protein